MEEDLPIALRRPRRSIARQDLPGPVGARSVKTPKKSKKKVRFSDPGPAYTTPDDVLSTGLTPMVRRTSLASSTCRRIHRQCTPSRMCSSGSGNSKTPDTPFSGTMTFLPLRQVLDGRVQRRLRRNGLSEEMNIINQEKRRRARESQEEISRLRDELREKDLEIHRLQNETIVLDTERIWDLERQVVELRAQLAERSGVSTQPNDESRYDWTVMARDPFVRNPYGYVDDMDVATVENDDREEFGDATMADLQCSTPTRARNSIPTPPATSPFAMPTPSSCALPLPLPTPMSHVGVQAYLPDPERQYLEDELASLQLEVCKLNTTLESYQALAARLNGNLASFATENDVHDAAPEKEVEARLEGLLRALSDRTAALLEVTSSLSQLGFPGNDASEIIASLAAGFRTARLELEYLTPGEITLPLTSHGAEILDLLLTRVRDLAKRAKEDETAIDEYHDIELSLRQQLTARVTVMDNLTADLKKAQEQLSEKDTKIAELEVGLDRLKGAVNSYVCDMAELESLVERLEAEDKERQAGHEKLLAANREIIVSKESYTSELEAKLRDAMAQADELRSQVDGFQTARASVNKQHGAALALRDARVTELRGEIDSINESLRSAHETIRSLRIDKSMLETKISDEKLKAKQVIDSMRDELQRVVRAGQDMLETPRKSRAHSGRGLMGGGDPEGLPAKDAVPSSPLATGVVIKPGGMLAGDLARRQSTKKRRRYDSGLGFLDEDDVEA